MIKVTPLGAGQDVGRSCLLLSIGPKNVLLDCGMHMAYDDERRFPDFSFIGRSGAELTRLIDCVIISHFHLDHCGALPYLTEMCGYQGPVYMTQPTRAICPLLLEDYRKITVDRKGEQNFFTQADIRSCMRKIICINLHECVQVQHNDDLDDGECNDNDDYYKSDNGGVMLSQPQLTITAYYAGHVLGAAMLLIRYGDLSVVYTGDYNMTPDRHLGCAWIDRCRPTLLITETTYGTTIRDSKRARERDFLRKVHDCVNNGGKVLIPVFALGRAQELCILLDGYWERMALGGKVPVYFAGGLTTKANQYYRLYTQWTNQQLKRSFAERNMFDFRHIKPFDIAYADQPGPQVLFASPGMLHAGYSLEVFKRWAGDPRNMVILPGYCAPGTVGARVLAGEEKIELDERTTIDVRLQIKHLSFSAHADAMGILQLIRQCQPENIMLVHGEAGKMGKLKENIAKEFGIACYDPPNGACVAIEPRLELPVLISAKLIDEVLGNQGNDSGRGGGDEYEDELGGRGESYNDEGEGLKPWLSSKRMNSCAVPVRGVLKTSKSTSATSESASETTGILEFTSATKEGSQLDSEKRQKKVIQLNFMQILGCLKHSLLQTDPNTIHRTIVGFIHSLLSTHSPQKSVLCEPDAGLVYFHRSTLSLYIPSASNEQNYQNSHGMYIVHLSWCLRDDLLASSVIRLINKYSF